MQRSGAAERDEREITGVERPGRPTRARTARAISASTTRTTCAAASSGAPLPRRASAARRAVDVERADPGQLGAGGDATEHEVGVGDRRRRRRRGRSRPGPGSAPALSGPTTSAPPGSSARDRATARADGVHCQRSAGGPGSPRRRAPAPARARRRCTRQTSVLVPPMSKPTASGNPHACGDRGRRPHACGGPGQQEPRRVRRGAGADRHQAARRRHHEHVGGERGRRRRGSARAQRLEAGVDDGGHRALVLAELRRDLVRAPHDHRSRPGRPLHGTAHLGLVRPVEVGVEQAHRHRIDRARGERVAQPGRERAVARLDDAHPTHRGGRRPRSAASRGTSAGGRSTCGS